MLLVKYFLWLIFYSFVGWVYEVAFAAVRRGIFVNRGFLNGPVCPVYGFGALAVIVAFYGRTTNPVWLFFGGMILCTAIEYLTAVLLETLFHAKWWDYSNRRFNFQGRVCLLGAVVFAVLTVAVVDGLHPLVDQATERIPNGLLIAMACILLVVILTDLTVTVHGLLGMNSRLREIQQAINDYMAPHRQKAETVRKELLARFEESRFYNDQLRLIAALKNRQARRMMRAFPRMYSVRYREAWDHLKQKLRENRPHRS